MMMMMIIRLHKKALVHSCSFRYTPRAWCLTTTIASTEAYQRSINCRSSQILMCRPPPHVLFVFDYFCSVMCAVVVILFCVKWCRSCCSRNLLRQYGHGLSCMSRFFIFCAFVMQIFTIKFFAFFVYMIHWNPIGKPNNYMRWSDTFQVWTKETSAP